MADTESLGVAGVEWLERWAALPAEQRTVRIPTITDPRGTDFAAAARLKQQPWMLELERRAIAAFEALGVLMTDTCINYQTIMPPVRGEHMAYGDTGVVIYSNSVLRRALEFRRRAVGLSAGLTGRTPRYGYHLDGAAAARRCWSRVDGRRASCTIGARSAASSARIAGDYWQVPALIGIDRVPTSDEMKHFGAALASFGSVALFHMVGVTPEAMRLEDVVPEGVSLKAPRCRRSRHPRISGAPTSRTSERSMSWCSRRRSSASSKCAMLAAMLDGRRATIPMLVVTSPQVKPDADRIGITARIEAAGGPVLSGMCFYQSYAREMAEANGWQPLATNSAKLVNILGGYGYRPVLLSMERMRRRRPAPVEELA